jgi:NAD(P)-dependent dehydrogenase (short-subunit alcohol dehydrogenase family)
VDSAISGRLEGKIALVTRAGSGIGPTASLRFAAEGSAVAVLDLRAKAAADTAALAAKEDGRGTGRRGGRAKR